MSILNHPPNPHIPYEHSEYGQKLIQHITQRPDMDNLSNKELSDQIRALRNEMEERYREDQIRASWKSPEPQTFPKGGKEDRERYLQEAELEENAEKITPSISNSTSEDTVGVICAFLFVAFVFFLAFLLIDKMIG